MDDGALFQAVMAAVDSELFKRPILLDWRAVDEAMRLRNGMPLMISLSLGSTK